MTRHHHFAALGLLAPVLLFTPGAQAPRPTSFAGFLSGVHVLSARDAWAVGSTNGNAPLILRWNGRTWRRMGGPAGGFLTDVAASSRRSAWAVGYTTAGAPLILRWNGSAWKAMRGPTVSGGAVLTAVITVSGQDAWAVGGTGEGTVILHWNGAAWTRVHSGGSVLYGVAAVNARSIWAVGTTNSVTTLILHWNGKSWRRVPSPGDGVLIGVAVASARDAWAVGQSTAGQPLILHWTGHAWRRAASPRLQGASLASVEATSPTSAWAVGSDDQGALVERWNGSAWSQVPGPANAFLAAVSARGATFAVGRASAGPQPRTVILRLPER